jgi:hypothetical protein
MVGGDLDMRRYPPKAGAVRKQLEAMTHWFGEPDALDRRRFAELPEPRSTADADRDEREGEEADEVRQSTGDRQ